MTRRSNLSTATYLLLVFLSGVLVGVFSYRLYMVNTVLSGQPGTVARTPPRNPEEYRKRAVSEMTARLKLSAEQVGTLQQIMDETRQRYHDLRERQKPDLKAIETEDYQRVLTMLSEPQRAEYEKMRAERERRRQQAESNKGK